MGTFDVFPDADHTPGFQPLFDYEGKEAPYIVSSCGFSMCPGWPRAPEENPADAACCKRLGDSLTQAKYQGRCQRDTLCGGVCKDTDFGNIPGGDGHCKFSPFDPNQGTLIGSTDCAQSRGSSAGSVVDSCRGAQE